MSGCVQAAAAVARGVLETRIVDKLTTAFMPTFLEVVNESFKHAVPKGAETHFRCTIVSTRFEAVKLIDRHRLVHDVLADELSGGVHALSIQAKTPAQWAQSPTPHATPSCAGHAK